jgi:hypothetical protein
MEHGERNDERKGMGRVSQLHSDKTLIKELWLASLKKATKSAKKVIRRY